MRPSDQRQAIVMVESLRDILPKRVSSATGGNTPAAPVIRVRPQKIAHRSFVRDLLNTVQGSDVVKSVDTWRQTAVQAEDLIIDQSGERKVVKQVGEVLPDVGVAVFAEALVVEAVYLSDLAGLVVSSKDGYALGVSNLERDQQGDRLDRVITSINIIAYARPSA